VTVTETPTHPQPICAARLLYRHCRDRAAEHIARVDAQAARELAEQARAAAQGAADDARYWAPGIPELADPDAWTGYPETTLADRTTRPPCAVTRLGDDIWAWAPDDPDADAMVTLIGPCPCGRYRTTAIHDLDDVAYALALAYDNRDRPCFSH
jgi:hypothetical protein